MTGRIFKTLTLALAFNMTALSPAQAQEQPRHAAVVIDSATGKILHGQNATEQLYPASTAKVMTAYLVFEAVRDGRLKMGDRLRISRYAASRPRTNLAMMGRDGRQVLREISVQDALLGLIVHSANDAAVVLAEAVSGSEKAFVQAMNVRAKDLGLERTAFRNPSGLPHPAQKTTVLDIARLSQAVIRDFPQHYPMFSTRAFSFNGATYENFNDLLDSYPGIDGLKTGYTHASGFNLSASAVRGTQRIIAVIFGAPSREKRSWNMRVLLDMGFARLESSSKPPFPSREAQDWNGGAAFLEKPTP